MHAPRRGPSTRPSTCPGRSSSGRSRRLTPSNWCADLVRWIYLIPILIGLVRPADRDADIARLLVGQLGQLHADLVEMQPGDLFVEMLGQRVDLLLVLAGIAPQLDLRQRLVGERRRHDEARMAHGIAEIDQAAFGQKDDALL